MNVVLTVCDKGCERSLPRSGRRGSGQTRKSNQLWSFLNVKRPKQSTKETRLSDSSTSLQVKSPSTCLVERHSNCIAEIQNKIYEYAAEYAHRHWPYIPKPESEREVIVTGYRKGPIIFPYHVCRKIRSEFRPIWLSTNLIPFEAMLSYLRTFFPYYAPKKRSLYPQSSSFAMAETGRLRVWVRRDRIDFRSFMRLLKHKAQYPKHTITCHAITNMESSILRWLEQIINNTNPVWMRWIKTSKVGMVEIVNYGHRYWSEVQTLHISMKYQYAEAWMEAPDTSPEYLEHLERIGLPTGGKTTFRISV
jgi:hypothetical protein